MVLEWSRRNRLDLSVGTTKTMFLKGRVVGRPSIVKLGNYRIEYVSKYKYLGVILDERLSFKPHHEYISRKAVDAFYKIGRLAKANWGLGVRKLKMIYQGIGDSILLYGGVAWAHRMELSTYANGLVRAQISMLIMVCRMYRTLLADPGDSSRIRLFSILRE